MNKLVKLIVAVLGACSIVFDIVTPLIICLFLVTSINYNPFFTNVLLIAGMCASLYRGIKHLLRINENE